MIGLSSRYPFFFDLGRLCPGCHWLRPAWQHPCVCRPINYLLSLLIHEYPCTSDLCAREEPFVPCAKLLATWTWNNKPARYLSCIILKSVFMRIASRRMSIWLVASPTHPVGVHSYIVLRNVTSKRPHYTTHPEAFPRMFAAAEPWIEKRITADSMTLRMSCCPKWNQWCPWEWNVLPTLSRCKPPGMNKGE